MSAAWGHRGRPPAGVLADAEAQGETVKRVRRRRAHGVFPSRKAGTGMAGHMWFDEAELDCMHLLEADALVRSYRPRPGKVVVTVGGERHEHTPSFLVTGGPRRVVFDVVETPRGGDGAAGRMQDPRPDLSAALREALEGRGYGYTVWTRARVRLQPRFNNACELVRHISVDPRAEDELRAADAIVAAGGMAERQAVVAALGGDGAWSRVCALALAGFLSLDTSKPFSDRTPVRLLPRGDGAR